MTALLVLAVTASLVQEQPAARRESIEWTDAWMPHTNDHDLPRVMLIGDSITRSYYPAVEEKLKGKAYVSRYTTSKAIGDPALLTELAVFLKQNRYAVVHFNIGMHGWAYTEDEYRQHWPALLSAIRESAPGARLIWASTTPVRKDREGKNAGPRNDRIQARNAVARTLSDREKIPVDDLHALMSGHADMHTDDVHFSKEGSALMAEQVAREIAKLLN
jgi:lysophospholipase L1-like esterase